MHRTGRLVGIVGSLVLIATSVAAQAKRVSADEQDAMIITFKDGHRQTIAMADVARIEFGGSQVSATGSTNFLGRWEVGNGMGGTFTITLKRGGKASKTLGSSHGTWKLVGDEARIKWDDGWRDVIRKAGNRYEKVAYRPGRTFTDAPDHIADATSLDPI